MQDATADQAKKSGQKTELALPHENTALDRRYHQIGISAVAAAVRYQGAAKNPAYAPVSTKWQDFAGDAA